MEKARSEKMQLCEKGRTVAEEKGVLTTSGGSGGSNSGLADTAGAMTSGQRRHEILLAVVAGRHSGINVCQNTKGLRARLAVERLLDRRRPAANRSRS